MTQTKKNKTVSHPPTILSIDTSCDETSAAVTKGTIVLANIIASQAQIHAPYGGVFPDVAKIAHQQNIKPTIKTALKRAGVSWQDIDAIAVTLGPGLAPALEIGIAYAQKLAQEKNKPLLTVNHIEAHLLSVLAKRNKKIYQNNKKQPQWQLAQLNQAQNWPALGIVVSGGHSEFIKVNQIGNYQILGQTVDDAAGEALDKVGRMLNLGYPAGPVIEKLAKQGDKTCFKFPLPMTTVKNYNLSYSGLKTAALRKMRQLEKTAKLDQQAIKNFAASFENIVFKHLSYKLEKLLADLQSQYQFKQVWLGGGVAANTHLRKKIRQTLKPFSLKLRTPFEKRLCGDNAAMIGIAANFKLQAGLAVCKQSQLDRKPSWAVEQAWQQ